MEFLRNYFNCTDYKLKYEKEKRKYEELLYFVEQINNQHEEILDLFGERRRLQNKVAGVKFEK